MIFVFMITVVLAVCNARPNGANKLKGSAVNTITASRGRIERKSFPVDTNVGNQPLDAKSSNPIAYSDAMVKALAFMSEGNVVLEQDDNGTPNIPFDDLFVMVSERGERVDLSYSEIAMIRDVNHRLNSIFETTPGSVTPAITTVIQGAASGGQQRVFSANSRSTSFNIGQRSGNSGVGTAEIGFIPSRKVGQSVINNGFAERMQMRSGNSGRQNGQTVTSDAFAGNMQLRSGINGGRVGQSVTNNAIAGSMQFGSGNHGLHIGGLNAFQQQQMYKLQMKQRLQAIRYAMLSRMHLRPMIYPLLFRRFPF